jgi:hypothetical protein
MGFCFDDVNSPNVDDFWNKWNTADYVVYGLPLNYCGDGGPIAKERPPTYTCVFFLIPDQVWKGPETLPLLKVSTSYDFHFWFCCIPPGFIHWVPEGCALGVVAYERAVFFLRFVDGDLQTYMCFGSGIYDLSWLQDEVGTPVAVEQGCWGSIKAIYR